MTTAMLARGNVELKVFFRDKSTIGFVFALPAILLVLLCAIFGKQAAASGLHGVTVAQLYVAGMTAGGIAATSFQYLGIAIAVERGNGMLKRLSGTPMAPATYFAGKVIQVAVCALAETVILLAVGSAYYHVRLPDQPGQWLTFAWVFLLGTAACAIAGIAVSGIPRTQAGVGPIISLTFTVLQFISGVYVPLNNVPPWLRDIASLFPLKWMAQGFRSVFLPGAAARLEPAGTWQHGITALVLLAWIGGGLVVCARTFRWQNRD